MVLNYKFLFRFVSILFVVGFMWACNKGTDLTGKASLAKKSRVDNLMDLMTLEEKVGQMTQYNGFWDATGPVPNEGDAKVKYEHLKSGLVGSVLNVTGVENVRSMQETVVNESRLGIPLIFGLDVIHGHKTLSPIPLAEAASWDLKLIEKSARIGAIESSARGINWTFAPMVDISRDARWGRVMEGAGEDTYLGCKIAKARVRGFQGDDLSSSNTIAATAKHFAGYGFAEAGRDYNTADVGTATLYNVILPPFKACVDANVATVMNSFNVLNGVPATGDEFLQRGILKKKWNFKGFVISDWGSGKEMIDHGFASDLKDATVKAANAGSDMDMESHGNIKYLADAVREGLVSMKHIDDAARRILEIKESLGLFDDPYKYCDLAKGKELIYHEDHMDAALALAKKSIVLLKNDGALLPIKKDQERIVVIGALASDKNSPLGSWRIGSDDNTAVSVIEGLNKLNVKHDFARGPSLVAGPTSFINEVKINNDDRSGFKEAVAAAKTAEVVIMVLGEHGFQSGEGRSRTNLDLPGMQQELLEAVHEVNKNIVLVVMSGRPLVLSWADENISSIVQAWQLGTQSGNAIAEVLTGSQNPSGKLPMSFPRSVGQVPIYYNSLSTGRPGPSDLVFWTHYIDEENTPLYPFGHGLSYTQFSYDNLNVQNAWKSNKKIRVSVALSNIGEIHGEEVVQLYIRDVVARVARPVKELKGFKSISLSPGESSTVEFELTAAELGYFLQNGKYIMEPGKFEVFVGGSSDTRLSTSFEIKNPANPSLD